MNLSHLVIGGLLISIATGFYGYGLGHKHERKTWELSVAKQKAEAEKVLGAAYAAKAKKEQEDADKAREVDSMHATLLADAYASRDTFASRLRDARRGASCNGPVPSASTDPSKPTDIAGGSGVGLGRALVVDPVLQARDGVNQLQAFAKTCHTWALTVGR